MWLTWWREPTAVCQVCITQLSTSLIFFSNCIMIKSSANWQRSQPMTEGSTSNEWSWDTYLRPTTVNCLLESTLQDQICYFLKDLMLASVPTSIVYIFCWTSCNWRRRNSCHRGKVNNLSAGQSVSKGLLLTMTESRQYWNCRLHDQLKRCNYWWNLWGAVAGRGEELSEVAEFRRPGCYYTLVQEQGKAGHYC